AASLESLASLHLRPADLDRAGLHPQLGPVTLRQLLATWVVHDLNHLAQIARVLAARHADDVGVWREDLPILAAGKRRGWAGRRPAQAPRVPEPGLPAVSSLPGAGRAPRNRWLRTACRAWSG